MVLYPQYRFELYKKNGENSFQTTPTLITGFDSLDFRGGIETTKDVLTVKFPNEQVSVGSYSKYFGKKSKTDNIFNIDDEIKFYGYYDSLPSNKDDALIIAGRVQSFSYGPNGNNYTYTVKTINRTEELLNTLIPYSSRYNTGSANTSPTAIKQIVNRLNQFNNSKQLFAYLDSETNPYTGSSGTIQALNSGSQAFPTIDYNETWKPVYYTVEKLSSPEYTGDDSAGTYIYYLKYTPVLPQYKQQFGDTINELVWKPKSSDINGSLTDGIDIQDVSVSIDTKDIQNILIVNAGTDFKGAGITGVAYDTLSIGKYGGKAGYYTRGRQMFSKIANYEASYFENQTGSTIDSDGMPESTAFPVTMSFQDRDSVTGDFNGSSLSASSKKDWNQYLRNEARWQAVKQADKVIEKLGEPKYSIKANMYIGSNNITLGGIYTFVVPSMGWDGTVSNPGYKLRINDIQHTWDKNGWTTQLTAEEDEKVVSEQLGNTGVN